MIKTTYFVSNHIHSYKSNLARSKNKYIYQNWSQSKKKKRETKKKDTDTLTSVGAVGYIKSIIFQDVIFMGFGVVFAFIWMAI